MRYFFALLACVFFSDLFGVVLDDVNYEFSFDVPVDTYHKYCKNIYSQNGEDGILQQLIQELSIENGTFCEFGASDGIISSNTYNLIKNYNFSGILIEVNEDLYNKCVENCRLFPDVEVFHGAVLYNNSNCDLNAWLKKGRLPYDFDLLSIDIDCDDYYVWDRLTDFAPKIVVFETNSYRDPVYEEIPRIPSTEYNIDLLQRWRPDRVALGCSFMSAVKLGLKKGYVPISYTGNLIFIRQDLLCKIQEFPYEIFDDPYGYMILYSPLVMWDNKWYTNNVLLLNVAIRDYYFHFREKHIDLDWLEMRMKKIQ